MEQAVEIGMILVVDPRPSEEHVRQHPVGLPLHGDCYITRLPIKFGIPMDFNQLKARLVFYPTLWWNMLLGRVLKIRNWWDPVTDEMVIGALPFADDVKNLKEIGVGAVVNTCQEYGGPVDEYKQAGIVQMRMPTVDFTHPRLEDVKSAVDFIEQQIAAGNRVYVHCKAGRARSATVVLCWLIKSKQMTAAEGQQVLLEKRPHVNRHLAQREVVQAFENEFLKEKRNPAS